LQQKRNKTLDMDVNTLYAASSIGSQDDLDTKIIKEVWAEGYSAMNAFDSEVNCSGLDGKTYSDCYEASRNCGADKACNEMATKYAKALQGGYRKDFEAFKAKTESLGKLGELGKDIFNWLARGRGQETVVAPQFQPQSEVKPKTGLYIGLGILAVAAIGTAIYFATKKK